ncbi:SRPBCC family protein [Geodermatophilus sp. YIM 151500]|uniref:SRPBCC family protein n=1 Tax=Geodermatophilus sp. YIM 151500 TaxID=2984531 RepID=UPI0021E4B70B|nr:SRPBCC family protein [Geodermatophilus sp. YIM 151500]MCV2491210.1 SRPBCC family protein [Geodermatophilus sp. YIM 151500]
MGTTAASGEREVAEPPERVWRALAELAPYCAVCDVSYVVRGEGRGATFSCVPGRREDGAPVADGAARGEIVEWEPPRVVTSLLRVHAETWTTRIELAPTGTGGTRVRMALSRAASGGTPLRRVLRGPADRRLVRRTLAAELDRLPEHIAQRAD